MYMKKISVLIALFLFGCKSSDSEVIDVRHQPLASTNMNYGNSDLTSFIEAVDGYDLVGLGETSHQGSKAFSFRSRMIKGLHEEGDLDLIAFEAGLYDGLAAWQNYLTGKQTLLDAVTGPDANYMFMHRLSAEMAGLFNYINDLDQQSTPLILAGYEARITSDPGCSVMFDELHDYLSTNGLNESNLTLIKDLAPKMMCPWYANSEYNQSEHNQLYAALNILEMTLESQKRRENVEAYDPLNPRNFKNYASFWLQIAKSLKAFSLTRINDEDLSYSDYQSADNVRWLREEWFDISGQTVVFGHNIHATSYQGSVIDATHDRYPDVSTYSVMQLTHTGYLAPYVPDSSTWDDNPERIQRAMGTLNHSLYASGYSDTFIDLNSQSEEQAKMFNSIQRVKIEFGTPTTVVPSKIMDGILFIPIEEPARAR
ncbi:erythromycin esterase [Aliivibrio fischeri]|nr:erythromycin esterase [Aliivibrio fischeri]